MNKIAAFVLLCLLAGCGSLDQTNANMERANALLQENSHVMSRSLDTIGENTKEVRRSTETMMQFESTIKENSSLLQRILGQLSKHPLFFPIVFFAILLLLLIPSVILYFAFKSLYRQMGALLAKKEKSR